MADDRGPVLQAVLIAGLVLCVVSTCLRFYTMGVLLKRFYLEDWLAVVSLVLYIVYTAVALLGVHYGVGKHLEDVDPWVRPTAMMWRWIGTYMYIVIAALLKVVIGLFLLRICSHHRWQRITLWALMGIVAVYNLFFIFLAIFACRPVDYQWTGYRPIPTEGTCNNSLLGTIPIYVATFLNVLADWILPLLPASLVWKTKMETRKKISVCAVMALGSIASIASIVRIPYAYTVIDNPEYLYTFEPLATWSTVEIGLGLTASSLATLTPLFRKIKVFTGGSTHESAVEDGGSKSHQRQKSHDIPPFSFENKGRRPSAKADDDVEAFKHKKSDEIELYRFGP